MAQPYIGEIRMIAGNFAPADGQENFNLPNMAGRIPLHFGVGPDGVNHELAEAAGVSSVTLTTQQIPVHSHPPLGSNATAGSNAPVNNVPATLPDAGVQAAYGQDEPLLTMTPAPIGPAGGSQPHDNYMPFGSLNYIISLFGIFPSPT